MTTPTQGEMRVVPMKLDSTWVLTQAQSLSADKSEDAVKALAWNLTIHHSRLMEKCAAPSAPVVGRDYQGLVNAAIDDLHILPHWKAGLNESQKRDIDAAFQNGVETAADAIFFALHASRFAENAKQAIDPRLTEWGYSTTEAAITHLGQLLEDQDAFDGLASPDKMEKGHD